ncbi:ssDNA-binding Zn-finger/Zn-ribbon topoisomerase 1 [Sphingomonas kyeonggiensis]|uniref:ogr/Delta-like zinc finger family protein n=1 Tax=Sphingomonas kyeonggiensis TaxID=1268553 RepID=UPI00277D8928|nr:ogr/Delta-like zinc finger family protein [Sphingomonas kyeonggiensis]MDQ0250940.1 ssDNA-binding Zn-finger/Zn-ribbon topoisomerase 1 [Sphingomonas kyeonggiensis]
MSRSPHGLLCPDCGGRLAIRSSRQEGTTLRQVFYQCENIEACGASFGGAVEITHRISAGVSPKPFAGLRTVPPRRRAANDTDPARTSGPEVPPASNDDSVDHALSQ